jgi:hypothetical protein
MTDHIAVHPPTNDDRFSLSVNDTPLLLSVNDTCRILSLGRTSVYALMNFGDLDTIKLGSRRLVRRPSCVALVERLARGPG